MKKHGRRSRCPSPAGTRRTREEVPSSFGLHIFPGRFSRRKMKLLLYQFPLLARSDPLLPSSSLPTARPVRSGRTEFRGSFLSHLSSRFPAPPSIPRAAPWNEDLPTYPRVSWPKFTGLPPRGCWSTRSKAVYSGESQPYTAAVGCWDTKDSFRDCGRNFAAVTDELLSRASCLILPPPVL